jgi:membrane-bound inhibitor of C-type lysozyme
MIRASFRCDGGKTIEARFINGAQSRVELTLSDRRTLKLPQAMSGSGARYANADESIVFWNKGNTAFIDEKGTTTYAGCVTGR